jgi:hypothetical protein
MAGFNSLQGQDIFLYSTAYRPAVGPRGSFLRVKWQGHEADHSHPSNVEVKNGGSVPPCLGGMVLN